MVCYGQECNSDMKGMLVADCGLWNQQGLGEEQRWGESPLDLIHILELHWNEAKSFASLNECWLS